MPVIRIEVPEGTPVETKRQIREGTKQAVLDTLAPKETKYDYVAVREVYAEIGDGVPLITVDLRPGREAERKKALVDAMAQLLQKELDVNANDTSMCSTGRTRLKITTVAVNHWHHGLRPANSIPKQKQSVGSFLFRTVSVYAASPFSALHFSAMLFSA